MCVFLELIGCLCPNLRLTLDQGLEPAPPPSQAVKKRKADELAVAPVVVVQKEVIQRAFCACFTCAAY